MKPLVLLLLISSSALAGPLDRPGSGLQPSTAQGYQSAHIVGTVFQKLRDGIIVDCGTVQKKKGGRPVDLVFVTGPYADRLFTGEKVNCTGTFVGSYEYDAVGGQAAIIKKYEVR